MEPTLPRIKLPEWNSEEEIGYKQQTTFFQDFGIANYFGEKGIRDTFNTAFNEWKNDKVYLTELAMVLNRWCWYFNQKDERLCSLYCKLFEKAYEWGINNFRGEDLAYFLDILD